MWRRDRCVRSEIHEVFRRNPRRGLRLAAIQVCSETSGVVTYTMAHRFVCHFLKEGGPQITPEVQQDVLDLLEWLLVTPNVPARVLNEIRKISRRAQRANVLAEAVCEQMAAHDLRTIERLCAKVVYHTAA